MTFESLFSSLIGFLFRILGRLLTIATILCILLALSGQIIRDHNVELGLLMYIPLIPLGIWTVFLDLLQKGRGLFFFRFSLTLIGLGIITWGYLSMMGRADVQAIANTYSTNLIKVLHWNVSWGGRGTNGWNRIRQEIKQQNPDIAIISELPSKSLFNQLLEDMGWNARKFYNYENKKHNPLAVCSSWPVRVERYVRVYRTFAVIMVVTVRGQDLRILAIDGSVNISKRHRLLLPRWRMPMLNDIVKTLKANKEQPIDIIAGDFNALSLSKGFDEFATAGGGYNLASKFSQDWRGTWKSSLPLYDIDHVWVHKRFQGLRAKLFTNSSSDHRGQMVVFQLP